MTDTPRGAPELVAAQAVPEQTVNEQVRHTEAGSGHFLVADNDLTAPPGTCADGASYIIAATATGAWAGKENYVATAMGANAASGWTYHAPKEGYTAYIQDENARHLCDGTAWALDTTGGTTYTDAQARAAVNIAPTTQSGTSYTAVLGDAGGYIQFTNGSAIAFTIPANASVAFATGTVITVEQNGAGVVTLTPDTGVTLRSRGSLLATAGQYAVCQVKKVATNTWTVIGDVA